MSRNWHRHWNNAECAGRYHHARQFGHMQNAALILDMGKIVGTRNFLLMLLVCNSKLCKFQVPVLLQSEIDSLGERQVQWRTNLGAINLAETEGCEGAQKCWQQESQWRASCSVESHVGFLKGGAFFSQAGPGATCVTSRYWWALPSCRRRLLPEKRKLGQMPVKMAKPSRLRTLLCGLLSGSMNRHDCREAWTQPSLKRISRIEHDLHRNSLDDFREVSCPIVRGKKTELRPPSPSNLYHFSAYLNSLKTLSLHL